MTSVVDVKINDSSLFECKTCSPKHNSCIQSRTSSVTRNKNEDEQHAIESSTSNGFVHNSIIIKENTTQAIDAKFY